jgi:hypothetical protein
MDPYSFEHVRSRHQEVSDQLMRLRNVVGVGVGYKMIAGEQTGDLSIAVSVTEKVPANHLPVSDVVPLEVEGVQTDVVRTGPIHAIDVNRRGAMRPARPGVSIGHYLITAGTLGCLVRREGVTYILSNNHVLAKVNEGQPGDPILQPGPADGGTPSHKLAELADYVPLRFPEPAPEPPSGCAALPATLLGLLTGQSPEPQQPPPPPPNQVDAALALPLDPAMVHPSIIEIGIPTGVAEPSLGARVQKSGRTTGLTEGTIRQLDVTADVIYGNQKLRFINQVITSPLSRPGDSGSAMLDGQNRVVGLMFGGSDYVTLFTPIAYVMAALNIEVVTA